MKSTHQITYDIFKKNVTRTIHECPGDVFSQEIFYDLAFRNRHVITTDEAMLFTNQDKLNEFVDEQSLKEFNRLFFNGRNGVILYPKDIIDFENQIIETARKTGNIIKVVDMVCEFCRDLGKNMSKVDTN